MPNRNDLLEEHQFSKPSSFFHSQSNRVHRYKIKSHEIYWKSIVRQFTTDNFHIKFILKNKRPFSLVNAVINISQCGSIEFTYCANINWWMLFSKWFKWIPRNFAAESIGRLAEKSADEQISVLVQNKKWWSLQCILNSIKSFNWKGTCDSRQSNEKKKKKNRSESTNQFAFYPKHINSNRNTQRTLKMPFEMRKSIGKWHKEIK